MRYLLLALALVACGKPAALHVSAGSAEPACTLPGLDVLCTLGGYTQQSAPKKYGSFVGPGFVHSDRDTLATLGNSAVAGDTAYYDGTKWAAAATTPVLQWVSGYTYPVPVPIALRAGAPTANSLECAPFYVPNPVTITAIGAEVTTGGDAGSLVRLGIYANDPTTNLPGSLVVDGGTASGASIGLVSVTVSKALSVGYYWGCEDSENVTTTAPTLRQVAQSSPHVWGVPSTSWSAAISAQAGPTQIALENAVSGAFPSTFSGSIVGTFPIRMSVSL